ncbi:MAG TPA: ribonuclease D [Candidatus Hydrogenedens sp.]|nr:ribonuclease D [Candidatus Hydrogenedens sp.]
MPHKSTYFTRTSYNIIQTREDWEQSLKILSVEPKIAIDIEANSLYEYPGEICLIQISTHGYDFLLDPLSNFPFPELGELLSDQKIEKIFHASEYDLHLLWHQYHWTVNRLFDTMWAGKLLGYKQLGLVSFLHTLLNVQHNKKFQKSNWKKRPLSIQQLSYASRDSHYLIQLEKKLKEQLIKKGLWDEAQEIFEELPKEIIKKEKESTQLIRMIRNNNLSSPNIHVLCELYRYRDELGKSLHIPPGQLISNKCLINLAKTIPTTIDELNKMPRIQSIMKKVDKQELLYIISNSSTKNDDIPIPIQKNNNQQIKKRTSYLMQWRKEQAIIRNVDSDVVLPKTKLAILAIHGPKTYQDLLKLKVLGPVRLKMYGEQITEVLKKADEVFEQSHS